MTLKIKYEALEEFEKGRPNKGVASQFSIPGSILATWKNNKEKIFEVFQNSSLKRQRLKTWIYEKLNEALLKWFTSIHGSNIPISGPILLEKAMNLLRPSITAILQHRTDGCWKGCSSLAWTILYIVKKHPLLIFSKCGWNNLNSYNSKTHVIQTNFESPWGFELYEFNFNMHAQIKKWITKSDWSHKMVERELAWRPYQMLNAELET